MGGGDGGEGRDPGSWMRLGRRFETYRAPDRCQRGMEFYIRVVGRDFEVVLGGNVVYREVDGRKGKTCWWKEGGFQELWDSIQRVMMATREVRRMNITDDERPSILFFSFLPVPVYLVPVLGSFPFGCLGCRLSFDFISWELLLLFSFLFLV